MTTALFPSPGHAHQKCQRVALATARQLCQQRGLRFTALRHRILDLIWQDHRPVKAYDLLEQLGDGERRAAPPTVYRTLHFLEQQGLVHRLESLNAFFGCNRPLDPHAVQVLICQDCEGVAELHDPRIRGVLQERSSAVGFSLDRQTLEMTGICARCMHSRRGSRCSS